MLITDP